MIDEANRLSMLVNDILDLSKMKEAAPRLKLETFVLLIYCRRQYIIIKN